MERELKNKVIVVTGGARGIGYAIADNFLEHGAKIVILLDIIETTGARAANTLSNKHGDGKAVFKKCDVVRDLDKVSSQILQEYEVDVLVNNAGIGDESSARRTIEVNTIAVVEWGMKFWEYMRMDKGGRGGTIFNVVSIYGYRCDPWSVYYTTSKHANMGFTKTLGHAYNYRKTGVRVIAICPGFTETDLGDNCNLFDIHGEIFGSFMETVKLQQADAVGKAAVDVFVTAESGTAWESENEKTIKPVPTCD